MTGGYTGGVRILSPEEQARIQADFEAHMAVRERRRRAAGVVLTPVRMLVRVVQVFVRGTAYVSVVTMLVGIGLLIAAAVDKWGHGIAPPDGRVFYGVVLSVMPFALFVAAALLKKAWKALCDITGK